MTIGGLVDAGAQVRVAGPSRAVLAVATGALVVLTSAATAFVVLTGTGAVTRAGPSLSPLPPAAAPPTGPPMVELLPGALGLPVPAPVLQLPAAPVRPRLGDVSGTPVVVLAAPSPVLTPEALLPFVPVPTVDPGPAPRGPVAPVQVEGPVQDPDSAQPDEADNRRSRGNGYPNGSDLRDGGGTGPKKAVEDGATAGGFRTAYAAARTGGTDSGAPAAAGQAGETTKASGGNAGKAGKGSSKASKASKASKGSKASKTGKSKQGKKARARSARA